MILRTTPPYIPTGSALIRRRGSLGASFEDSLDDCVLRGEGNATE
jgi:hypothetical protein